MFNVIWPLAKSNSKFGKYKSMFTKTVEYYAMKLNTVPSDKEFVWKVLVFSKIIKSKIIRYLVEML